ncbi:hypothetical protein PC122_g16592, partial [Phytophthora cactorum]
LRSVADQHHALALLPFRELRIHRVANCRKRLVALRAELARPELVHGDHCSALPQRCRSRSGKSHQALVSRRRYPRCLGCQGLLSFCACG